MSMPSKLSPTQKQELAEAYKNGVSLKDLQAAFEVSFSTIRSVVVGCGGTLRNVGRPHKATV